MHRTNPILRLAIIIILSSLASSQQFDAKLFEGMRWRLIGPFRAGRVTAVSGIAGDPTTYYMGTPGGGVWKTTDGGIVWKPIFDEAHVASIGALQIAPSNSNIIYVGTGEQTDGNGVYRSSDAGATWTNIGLRDTRIINSLLVDPQDPNVVFVGAMGGPQPSAERGVFKSTDAGKTWSKVLFKDDAFGVVDMCFDPGNHKVLFAAFWRASGGFFKPTSGEKVTGPDVSSTSPQTKEKRGSSSPEPVSLTITSGELELLWRPVIAVGVSSPLWTQDCFDPTTAATPGSALPLTLA